MEETNVIRSFIGKYDFLSNTYPCIIRDEEGPEYGSVERAYQASKAGISDTEPHSARSRTRKKSGSAGGGRRTACSKGNRTPNVRYKAKSREIFSRGFRLKTKRLCV